MARSTTKKKSKLKSKTTTRKASKLPKRKKATAKKSAAKKKATKKKVKAARKPTKKRMVKKITQKTLTRADTTPIQRVSEGDQAPDFQIHDQNGQTVQLSQLRGKNVVLYFYPKDDTPGCTIEACSFRDHLGTLQQHNTVVLGVSFDDQDSHQKFINKYNLNFQLLSDLDKKVAEAYGVYVQKNMYGNISWGIERSTFVINKEGVIAKAFRRVKVEGHTQQVLEVLQGLA
jgi:peroxiredoxin Q/BCP